MKNNSPIEILEKIFKISEPFSSWVSFWKISVYGFIFISVLDLFFANFLNKIFQPPANYRILLFLSTYIVPFIIYFFIFILCRSYSLRIVFSQKTNVVLAYNLKGINQDKFQRKYNNLVETLRNEINMHNLGNKIKIIVCPSDISIKGNDVAEAKTKLGLLGSTILAWGYVVKEKGKHKFVTKFSYEFSHPTHIKEGQAKEMMTGYFEKNFGKGLISPKMDVNNFNDQLLPTVFFILGVTTYTAKLYDKAEMFFNSFMSAYKKVDLMRKVDLGPAFVEVNEHLLSIYQNRMIALSLEPEKNKEKMKEIADKILSIDANDYSACVALSFCYEHMGNREEALRFHNLADTKAKKNQHLHLFNGSYFALTRGDYPTAISLYRKIPETTMVNTSGVCIDLDKQYKRTKNPAFLFADGFVNYQWESEKMGKQLLKKFISKVGINTDYKTLADEARGILGTT